MSNAGALAEIAVSNADAETRHIYERIMTLTGVGSPALIYRHFAVFPGFLPWVWKFVGPELESGLLAGHALKNVDDLPVVSLPAVSAQDLTDCGIDSGAHALIDAMLATYNRMNPINLALIAAIRNKLDVNFHRPSCATNLEMIEAPAPGPVHSLPAPLNVDTMSNELRTKIAELSAAIPSPGVQVTPTLYRHLAIWPKFVFHLAPGILAAIERGDVEERMSMLTEATQPLIQYVMQRADERQLPDAPLDDPAAMVRTLDTFAYVIPQLVVIGTALRKAIPASNS